MLHETKLVYCFSRSLHHPRFKHRSIEFLIMMMTIIKGNLSVDRWGWQQQCGHRHIQTAAVEPSRTGKAAVSLTANTGCNAAGSGVNVCIISNLKLTLLISLIAHSLAAVFCFYRQCALNFVSYCIQLMHF